jgi:multiple sugar transport system permease protein
MSFSAQQRQVMWAMVLPAVCYVVVFLVYPLWELIAASFTQWSLVRNDLGRQFIGVANYVTLFNDGEARASIVKTIVFVIGVSGMQVVLGLLIAVALNRGLKGEGMVRALILVPWFVPPIVVGFSWLFMLQPNFGILLHIVRLLGFEEVARQPPLSNGVLAMLFVIMVHVWSGVPGIVLICTAGLKGLPGEVLEAAKVDGATPFAQFIHITVPLLWPVIMVACFLTVSFSVRAFDILKIMTDGGPGSATQVLALYQHKVGISSFDIGYGSTIALVLLVLSLGLSAIFLRGMMRQADE